MLQVDLSELPAAVADELVKGRHARDTMTLLKAPENQLRVAQSNAVEWKSLDGLGAPTLSITPEAYHYWGQRLGYACWSDKQFLREFKRDNPACRINAKGTRIQSGAMGSLRGGLESDVLSPVSGCGTRFHKSYG